jgi:hypothetical protein
MATAAQIEANRQNARKSTGPRTEEGKNRSRLNALDHVGRANLMVLPTEVFGEYENELKAWKLSFQPRNPAEEVLVERLVSLGWQQKRIDRAQTARLTRRIYHGEIEEADSVQEEVIELGQKLFQDACGPLALHLERDMSQICGQDGENLRISAYGDDEDQPMRLVHCLQATGAGCRWMLEKWASLRVLLERGVAWLAPDKLKAVRLLGRHPIDAFDSPDVARVYLASFMLVNQEGNPFREILNELSDSEVPIYVSYLKQRQYGALAPKDAVAARQMLLEIVDRATAALQEKVEMFRQLAELDAVSAADRLSWDDTAEGERVRRYELTCERTWLRVFDLLLKVRQKGGELEFATVKSLGRSLPSENMGTIDTTVPLATNVITPPAEPVEQPDPSIEAKFEPENAPNEPNSYVQAPSREHRDGGKELRIDTPHVERKPGGGGITGKEKIHSGIRRLQTGRESTLMDLSPIFGRSERGGS